MGGTGSAGNGWCPFAVHRPINAGNFTVGRFGQPIKAVVLHVAAGPFTAIYPTFNRRFGLTSAHFAVSKAGVIEQYLSINDTAFANGLRFVKAQWYNTRGKVVYPAWPDIEPPVNPNFQTISIEHEGQPQEAWTPEMYAANNRLLVWIAQDTGLTWTPYRTLIGHCHLDTADRPNCPGPSVDYARICEDANKGEVKRWQQDEQPTTGCDSTLTVTTCRVMRANSKR